ncbi:hypothetical protein LTR62_006811 [Meristemomyces frigidus]|uniref:Helix-turn-helix domain-containing protein n=1 Tax=Meristemomyces frigidus TaxID=1508187 RepID=A0AAN7YEA7_9PEZI|nr:hypothetical protein LTR62_006811 [Meristemomyces frigidus]
MGASGSKASRAAGSAARKYPARSAIPSTSTTSTNAPPPPPPAAPRAPGPTVRPPPHATGARDEAINLDASDPDFARSLRSLGAVQPNPTMSESSAFSNNAQYAMRQPIGPDPSKNPAIAVLEARSRLADQAELEFQQAGRRGHEGRQFLDVYMIRQILVQRDEKGKSAAEIEKSMGLKRGVVERLGARGVVGLAQQQGRAEKEVFIV